MQYGEFIEGVENNLQPISYEEAERAAASTLSTLSEIVSPNAARNLGSHLPRGLEDKLNYNSPEDPREFAASELSLEDFCDMVAEKEGAGVNVEEARDHAIGVMKVVKEAYGAGNDLGSNARRIEETELEEIRAQLPEDFAPLFT